MKLKLIALFSVVTSLFVLAHDKTTTAQQRRFQSNSQNYIGVGITTSGLAAYSKLNLGEQFSVRPQIIFDDIDEDFNGRVSIPLTYDFEFRGSKAKPFVGIAGGSQTRDFDLGLEFVTGVDYGLSDRFTATGLFNIQLFDENDISAIFGLGLNL